MVEKLVAYVRGKVTTDQGGEYGGYYFYTHFYMAQAMYQRGGEDWKNYYPKAAKRLLIDSLLARAKSGEDFANLARQYSEDPGSGAKGGDLGYNARGRMVPEFDEVMFALERVRDIVRAQPALAGEEPFRAVVAGDRVDHLRPLVESPADVRPDLRVTALHLVVHRLADVVQQPAPPGQRPVQAQLVGHDLAKVRHLGAVL